MATTEPSTEGSKSPADMSSAAAVAKPIAAIFTKQGLQKCMEQQVAAKPKRSRTKEKPKTASDSVPPALTPPDSAQETAIEPPVPKRRGRPPKGTPAGTSKPGSRATSTAKGKRKKKDDDEADFKAPASKAVSTVKLTRAALKAEDQQSAASAPVSTAVSEAGSEVAIATMEDITQHLVDPNHSRRKRRKKSPHSQTEDTTSPGGTDDGEDVVMTDAAVTDIPLAEIQSVGVSRTIEVVVQMTAPQPVGESPKDSNCEPPPQVEAPQKPFPSLKPLHPFFTPGGLKKTEPTPEVKPEVKVVHPFFAPGGKKKPKATPQPTQVNPIIAIAPSITTKSAKDVAAVAVNTPPNGFVRSSLGPRSKPASKIHGGLEAPWPDRQQRHVRQLSPTHTDAPAPKPSSIPYRNVRKLKSRRVEITAAEDLLVNLAKSLDIPGCQDKVSKPNYHEEQYFRVSSTLRLPKRHILTGSQLQDKVRKRTATRLPFPGPSIVQTTREDSVSTADSGEYEPKKVHSALTWLYYNLHDFITPFDVGGHETQLWTQKYAPQHSADVLQVGREMDVLRDWISKLKVDTGGENPRVKKKKRKTKAKDGAVPGKGRRRKKKKRAKGDGLDDFLVDSEEELNEMDEITDPEDNGDPIAPSLIGAQGKKSTIRTGDKNASIAAQLGYVPGGGSSASGGGDNGRMVNAVVISGPQGCGKTAAVYAVAKEMGFTVFEVNPGSRRSGKDLLDQVGEMSKNHLVHQQKASAVDGASFFKQGKGKSKAKQIEEVIEKAQQTQSLILLEEADLLFEEDKQFWPTVMGLMAQSKRPIVITCNDESLLPLDDLLLHAILRLSPPPEDLTIDYLLLLAANEGHLLQRNEVTRLYHTLRGDLRAMITELNFWCQMGIGDRRAGLDWILTRFPVGCDIDDNGELKRVVSEDTYLGGIGWIPQKEDDDGVSPPHSISRRLREEDIWKQTWDEWGVDIGGDSSGTMRGMDGWAEGIINLRGLEERHLASQAMLFYAEALSDVDVYAGTGMRTLDNPVLDTTQPPLPASAHIDEILGYPLLETDLWPASPTSRNTITSLATTIRSLGRSYLAAETNALLESSSSSQTQTITPLTPTAIITTISGSRAPHPPAPIADLTPLPKPYLRAAFAHLTTPPASFLASTISTTTSSTTTTTTTTSTASSYNSLPGTPIITTTIHGPLAPLVLDIAPYIRAIIRHETQRGERGRADSSLLVHRGGAGGGGGRSTRASRLAMMEGGGRGWGRRERWFGLRGNGKWIVRTGGEAWGGYVQGVVERRGEWVEGED